MRKKVSARGSTTNGEQVRTDSCCLFSSLSLLFQYMQQRRQPKAGNGCGCEQLKDVCQKTAKRERGSNATKCQACDATKLGGVVNYAAKEEVAPEEGVGKRDLPLKFICRNMINASNKIKAKRIF